MSLILVQTLNKPVAGWWDGGLKDTFRWSVETDYPDGYTRVGSWEANYFFRVKTGKTEKQTLGNARRSLGGRSSRSRIKSTFSYVDRE